MVPGSCQRARAHAGQNLYSLVDRADRVNVEAAVRDRLDCLRVEHQVGDVGARQQHALRAAQADRLAHAIEAFDFLVGAADRLHRAVLIDRTGDGQVLAQRHAAQRRKQRVDFGRTGAIAIDSGVGLLERDARGHRGGQLLAEALAEEAAEDHHALVVSRSRQPRLALDIDYARLTERDGRGDARGPAEAVAAGVEHGEPVDLADLAALEMNDDRAFGDQAADLLFDEVQTAGCAR